MRDFSSYLVNPDTGFILNPKKKVELSDYYEPWLKLKWELEHLMEEGSLWDYVEKLPILSIRYLRSLEELCYCHCILAMVTSAYVWYKRSLEVPKVLPKTLAVPLRALSDELGTMPILTHTDLVLSNIIFDLTDSSCFMLREKIILNSNWTVFQMVTAKVELCFGPVIKVIACMSENINQNKVDNVLKSLKEITHVLNSMMSSMKLFDEMDPDYFHSEMRPFLTGWKGDSFPQKGGLQYENVDGSTTLIECTGASAGQSLTFQVLDIMFHIDHFKESRSFLDTMKMYMLKQHREFLRDLPTFFDLHHFSNNFWLKKVF